MSKKKNNKKPSIEDSYIAKLLSNPLFAINELFNATTNQKVKEIYGKIRKDANMLYEESSGRRLDGIYLELMPNAIIIYAISKTEEESEDRWKGVYDAYDDVLSKTAFDSYKSLTIAKMHSLISAIDDVYEKCDTNITTDNTAFKVNS